MNKSTPSSSSCNQSYRSAIALNNFGVSLLERQCYQQAGETLKDAVSLIRSVTLTETHLSLQEKMHAARQRLAKPQQDVRHAVVQVDVMTNTASANDMSSLLDDSPSCVVGSNRVFAIRVEDFDCDTTSEFISAILLHNFGLSYYCVAKTAKKGSTTERKYLNGAMRLFRISHTLFCKESAGNSEISFHFLHAMVVVLSTLVKTLRETKRESEVRSFCSILDQLRLTIAESQEMFGFDSGAAAAAA